jgi:lactate permease
MGASFQAMMAVTGLSSEYLGHWAAVLLGVAAYLCGICAVHVFGGWKMIRHSAVALMVIGTAMAGTQYLLVVSGMWTLGGFGASMAGLIACLIVARLKIYNQTKPSDVKSDMALGWALSAYLILIVVVFMGIVYTPLREFLGQVKLSLIFPETTSNTGWVVPAGKGKAINIFGHGGALLCYASIISYIVYNAKCYYRKGALNRIISGCIKSGVPTSLGIVSMVCFAMIMDHCGMIYLLAEGISRVFGGLYPFFSAWIGLLGAFMTGSNTNSNVVFGVLQQQTAELAGLSTAIILAAQTTGGALGGMIAPAKILVGCSTVGLSGKEAPVLQATIRYGLLITALIGLLTILLEVIL